MLYLFSRFSDEFIGGQTNENSFTCFECSSQERAVAFVYVVECSSDCYGSVLEMQDIRYSSPDALNRLKISRVSKTHLLLSNMFRSSNPDDRFTFAIGRQEVYSIR